LTLEAPEGGFVDFTEIGAFAYFDGHIIPVKDVLHFTTNERVQVEVIGRPLTEYHLALILASGESTAQGLGFTTSDEEGRAYWEFRIAWNVRPGRHSAVVSGGGDRLVLEVIIEQRAED
jgi:hypothetical protein